MSEWKTSKLSDVIEIIGGGTPKRSNPEYWNGDIPWLSVADFNNDFRYVSSSLEKITELGLKESSTKLLKKGQIIISARGTVGCLAQLSSPMAFNQSCYGLHGKDGLIDNGFLYYALKNKISELKQKTHGAVFDTITRDTFEYIDFSYPPIKEQQKIAKYLGNLDDKIQLNTQTNQTLEHIAQAIYKSWFVEYEPTRAKAAVLAAGGSKAEAESAAMTAISGKSAADLATLKQYEPARYQQLADLAQAFPAALTPTDDFGEIPEGWEYRKANELFDVGIGKTPPRKEEEWFSDSPGNVQWISIKDMGNSGTYVIDSSEYLTKEAVSKFNVRQIPENIVILSFKLTVGRVSITTTETTTNEAIAHFKITSKSCLTSEYLYLFLKNFDFDQLGSTSSIATAVNSKSVKNIFVLCPKKEIADLFQEHISGIFRQIKNLTWENKVLSEARDALLPKLLNGDFQDA